MTRWLFVLFVAVAVVAGPQVHAQSAEQEIMKAEQARAEARRKGDGAALVRSSTDDVFIIGPAGQVLDTNGAKALTPAPKYDIRDLTIHVFGDVAVVGGVQTGTGPAGDQQARFTRVWRKQGPQWLNAFGQISPMVSSPPAQAATSGGPRQIEPTKWPTGANQDERDVLQAQRTLNQLFAKKDAAAYAQHTSANFVRIGADGSTAPRAEFLKFVVATPDVKRVESNNSDFRVRVYGPVAIVSVIDKTPVGLPQGARQTRVYVKEDGTWKQLVGQSTAIAQP